jgi:hypothetical protein
MKRIICPDDLDDVPACLSVFSDPDISARFLAAAAAVRSSRGGRLGWHAAPAVAVIQYPSRVFDDLLPGCPHSVQREPRRQCRRCCTCTQQKQVRSPEAAAIQKGTVHASTRLPCPGAGKRRAGLRQGDPHLCLGRPDGRAAGIPTASPSRTPRPPPRRRTGRKARCGFASRIHVDLPLSRALATRSPTRPDPAIRALIRLHCVVFAGLT